MRFDKILKFKVEDLLLDEGNYRFKEADDQKSCISKIYSANPSYFKNLMSSIAEDSLGELLLVYKTEKKNIVLDGNRRLAALKVLNDPKEFSPSSAIQDHADSLIKKHKVDFSNISAQVSEDKQLIYKTVYERHAAGQGKGRINWSAYGAARFRYDQKMEDGNEWYAMAILLETERKHPEWTEFIDSSEYSYEVFRRIFKSAQDKGIVSSSIFSGRNQRIKTSVDRKLVTDAIRKTVSFLEAMRNKDISLSRGAKYADKASVDLFVEKFGLSPDNLRSQAPADDSSRANGSDKNSTPASDSNSSNSKDSDDASSNSNTDGNEDNNSSEGMGGGSQQSGSGASTKDRITGIEHSEAISQRLLILKSQKLISLYKSLCIVSAIQHPQLLYVGAWSFFESLTALHGRTDGTPFDGYLGSLMNNNLRLNKTEKRDFQQVLREISEKGNANKHSARNFTLSAIQLRNDFVTLEPLIIAVIDMIINTKRKS